MRIRIDGTRAEIVDALFRLRLHFTVYAVSRAYPDRARPHHWRVYLTTRARKEVTMPDDLTVIRYRCCTCGGTGLHSEGDRCTDCDGTGIDNHGA